MTLASSPKISAYQDSSIMKTIIFTLVFGLLMPLLTNAHHAFRTAYNFSKTDTLDGRVVRLELVNPHARLILDVINEDGEVEEWMVEGPGKLALARRGWTDDMFTAGERITAVGNPSSAGHNAIWLEKIVKSDGTEIIDPLITDQLAIEAERRERVRRATQ